MDAEKSAAEYTRASSTRGLVAPYADKFGGLIKLCEQAKAEGVRNLIIAWPWVIGDTYEEMIQSLSRLADAGIVLHIVAGEPLHQPSLPEITRN